MIETAMWMGKSCLLCGKPFHCNIHWPWPVMHVTYAETLLPVNAK